MSRAKPFLFGSLVGASLMFVALQYHLLRTHDGLQMVPRTPQHSLGLAWADIRHWSPTQWTDRPELARALLAHGSGSLISQSVTEQLAESVGAETATLDQLRTLLNRSTDDDSARNSDFFRLPDIAPLKSPDPPAVDEREQITIPFPRAAQALPEDPFRVTRSKDTAQGGRATVPEAIGTQPPSRFTAADILSTGRSSLPKSARAAVADADVPGRADPPGSSEKLKLPANPETAAPGTIRPLPATPGTVAEAAGAIFGRIPSQVSGTSTPATATPPATAAAPATAPAREFAPFEEVTTDLESRARAALSRAQATMSGQTESLTATAAKAAAGAASRTTDSATQFVRDQLATGAAPAGAATGTADAGKLLKSPVNSSAAPAAGQGTTISDSLRALREGFDPFLE